MMLLLVDGDVAVLLRHMVSLCVFFVVSMWDSFVVLLLLLLHGLLMVLR
jgi:hypothetical protein